jgi:hypothetical protein
MTKTDQSIQPALTPDEWKWAFADGLTIEGEEPDENGMWYPALDASVHRRETIADKPHDLDEADRGGPWYPEQAHIVLGDSVTISESHAPSIIALANAILPVDDERKITWSEVELIEEAATLMPAGRPYLAAALRDFAAHLAALLPPK